jgi:mono/diheme cytochrome c family protein
MTRLSFSALGAVIGLAAVLIAARTPENTPEGRVLYTRYCASCHGLEADGNGPVAAVLRHRPSDLRRLGERYGTPLPAERIARFIDGREAVAAHGPREMPVWGERFDGAEPEQRGGQPVIDRRIRMIVAYLETIAIPR